MGQAWSRIVSSIAAKDAWLIGPDGDDRPGTMGAAGIGRTVLSRARGGENIGPTNLRIGRSVVGTIIYDNAGVQRGRRLGPMEEWPEVPESPWLVIVNEHASTAGALSYALELGARANRGGKTRAPAFSPASGPRDEEPAVSAIIIGTPNTAVAVTCQIPPASPGKSGWNVTEIAYWCRTSPASSGGTYTLAITGAGNSLIASPPFSLESLVAKTVTTIPLTATAAHLELDPGDLVIITVTSNNADLVTDGPLLLGFKLAERA